MATDGLSIEATRLLAALRAVDATARERAVTDARLAELSGVDRRALFDAVIELTRTGYVLVAACSRPMGRYLCPPEERHHAAAYLRSLEVRAKRIFLHRQLFKFALARQHGQLSLPLEPRASARADAFG